MLKRIALTLAIFALPCLPAQQEGALGERVLRLPPPQIVEGDYEIEPLGHFPGELQGISADQDQIHHQRHYAAAVSHLNELATRMSSISYRNVFVIAITSQMVPFHRVVLHEIMWENMAPSATSAQVSEDLLILTEDVIAMTERIMANRATRSPCWLLVAMDLQTNKIQVHRGEGAAAPAPWGCIPLVVMDFFPHSSAIDNPGNPLASYDVQSSLQQPNAIAERLAMALRLSEHSNAPSFEPGIPRVGHMAGPNSRQINAITRQGLRPEPVVESEVIRETIEEVFGEALTEQKMALWMVWSPGLAVLGWDTHRNRPILLTVENPEDGGMWGVIPIVAYPRRIRPDRLDQAQYALSTMHWDHIRARVEELRTKIDG